MNKSNPYLDIMQNSCEQKHTDKGIRAVIITGSSVLGLAILTLVVLLCLKGIKDGNFSSNAITFDSQTENMSFDKNLTTEKEKVESPLSNRNVYYAGLEDCTITKDAVVYLENLRENEDIYMAYEIYTNDNELIHKTDLIPSGEFSKWYPGEVFESGNKYTVYIKHIPYYEVSEGEFTKLAYQPVNVINITVQ